MRFSGSEFRMIFAALGLTVALTGGLARSGEDPEPPEREPVRMLSLGSRRGEALREYEDVHEEYIEWCGRGAEGRSSVEGRRERDGIIALYEVLIDRYPRTEVAGMARLNVLGLYGGSDDTGRAESYYRELLEALPFTEYEMEAHTYLGLLWLQRKKSPVRAMEYFEAIPDPRETPYRLVMPGGFVPSKHGELRREESLYVDTRLHVLRCLMRQRRFDETERERARLVDEYPEAAEHINESLWQMKAEQFNLPIETEPGSPGVTEPSALDDILDVPLGPSNPNAPVSVLDVPVVAGASAVRTPAAPAVSPTASGRTCLTVVGVSCLLLAGALELVRRRVG